MDVPGGWSPWRLLFSLREKGKYFTHDRDFPVEPVILLRGAHALDFSEITRLPISDSGMRWHCGSFAGVWTVVSSYCERYARGAARHQRGGDQVPAGALAGAGVVTTNEILELLCQRFPNASADSNADEAAEAGNPR